MTDIIIVGAGWAGCAAAVAAAKQGTRVRLLERTDMILGTGLAGGILRNNGRLTAALELEAMGGADLFAALEPTLRHRNISFPGHDHADLYDIALAPGAVLDCLKRWGVTLRTQTRITGISMSADKTSIESVTDSHGNTYAADAFLDATGTAGPTANCARYGNGCSMCILRCPSFGGRVSLAALAGVRELEARRPDGTHGAMSGSCKLMKESLAPDLVRRLNETGVAVIPLPPGLREDHLSLKACQQYALPEFAENLVLLDSGHAKMMAPFFPLDKLRRIPGLENARYEDPYAGGKGNSVRFLAMCPRGGDLKVNGPDNLYCAGEKAGPLVGHTEAMVTGTLAGYNCAAAISGKPPLILPRSLASGEAIAWTGEEMRTPDGLSRKYTFSGGCLFERMKSLGLYRTSAGEIRGEVRALGLEDVFSEPAG